MSSSAVAAVDREVGSRMVMTLDTQALRLEEMRVPTVVTDTPRRAIVPVQGLVTYELVRRAAHEMGVLLDGSTGLMVLPTTTEWWRSARSGIGADDGDPAMSPVRADDMWQCTCKGRKWLGNDPYPCGCKCSGCIGTWNDLQCVTFISSGLLCGPCS